MGPVHPDVVKQPIQVIRDLYQNNRDSKGDFGVKDYVQKLIESGLKVGKIPKFSKILKIRSCASVGMSLFCERFMICRYLCCQKQV